jgi:site-specific recombinase XerD
MMGTERNRQEAVLPAAVCSLQPVEALVLNSVTSENTKRAYSRALRDFVSWFVGSGQRTLTKAVVDRYRTQLEAKGLASSTINLRLSALRKLAAEAADNDLLDVHIASGIMRVRSLRAHGVRTGNWLTADQAEALCLLPDITTLRGLRDRSILALLIGCGLRRMELVHLTIEHIQQRDGRWAIVDLIGKGNRVRTVPLPNWAKPIIDRWTEAAGIASGRIIRAVSKGQQVWGSGITAQALFNIVCGYGIDLKLGIAPHDLRRTFARLAHKGRAPIEQIQLSLGHSSIQTTERYLGVRQDLADAPCDHLGLRL